jgi:hypothetical protein
VTASKRVLFAGASIVLGAAFGLAGAAYSQTIGSALTSATTDENDSFRRDRNVSVTQRPHPGYEALGVREGAFMVWPKVAATVEYNDNIYATSTDKTDDTIFHIAPELDITSNWSRHSLSAYARSVINRYWDNTSENTEDYSVGANGQLDVLRTAQINGGLDWSKLTEPRTSSSSPLNSAHPIQYDLSSVYVAGAREFNRLRVSGRLDFKNFNYLNSESITGTPILENDRDRNLEIALARVDYALSPDTAVFVEVSGNRRDYRLDNPSRTDYPSFVDRDSKGYEALVGANFDLSALVRGEIGVGYLKQNYQSSTFNDVTGLGVRGQVEWFPTQLVTATFTGSRTLEDAGIPGSSGYLSSNAGVKVDYELLRNVILSGSASYGNDDYKGIDRTDKRGILGVSGTYLLNRNVGVTVGYSYFKQTSHGSDGGEDFKVNKIGATLTLQY